MEALFFSLAAYVMWSQVVSASVQVPKRAAHYLRCKRGDGIFQGNVIKTMTSRHLRCFEMCTRDDTCKSVNVCPAPGQGPEISNCELLDSYSPWFCKQLGAAPDAKCFHAEKVTKCRNGGRMKSDGTCKCDICLKGPECKEHVRDCQEAVEVLAPDGGYNAGAMCAIQPSTSPTPFNVWCPFNGNTMTILIYRVQTATGWSQLDWKTYMWNQYKHGMGRYDKLNFFVGLENMRTFLSQAAYRLNMFNIYISPPPVNPLKQPSYFNITLQDEANSYAWSYFLYTASDGTATDLESFQGANVSHPFCTKDNDCGTCATDNGPGWYYTGSGGCVGTSPFAIKAEWPYENLGLFTLGSTEYSFERVGDFY